MGVIIKQSIKGTVYNYIGVVIGFLNTALLQPLLLSAEEVGLLRIIITYANLGSSLTQFGFTNVISRYFPHFKTADNQHNGFLRLILWVLFIGFAVSLILLYFSWDFILTSGGEKSELFEQYALWLIPITLFTSVFTLYDSYNKMLFDASSGILLKELAQRVFILIALAGVAFHFIGFSTFMTAFVLANSLPGLMIVLLLLKRQQFKHPKLNQELLNSFSSSKMASVGFFTMLSLFGGIVLRQIDSIMINYYLDLSYTGIYVTVFYFGTLVAIPARTLVKIGSAIIADKFKDNDLKAINEVYYKSCINQFVVSMYLALGLLVCSAEIIQILPEEYAIAQHVMWIIGLVYAIEMLGGLSSPILTYSDHYKLSTFLMLFLVVLLIVTNAILIPVYGIYGAAYGSLFSMTLYTAIKAFVIYRKFKFQPYDTNYLKLIIPIGLSLLVYFLPSTGLFYIDLLLKGALLTLLYGTSVLALKVSTDINGLVLSTYQKIVRK